MFVCIIIVYLLCLSMSFGTGAQISAYDDLFMIEVVTGINLLYQP